MLWRQELLRSGLGGVAVADGVVVIGDRDLPDLSDVIRAFHADTGRPLWQFQYPAPGQLDYGNSPRATPLIHDGRVFLQGAHGHLTALKLDSGELLWQRDLALEFQQPRPSDWGACSSPLLAGNRLIVNPGAPDASLLALQPASGEMAWKTPGAAASHGSLVVGALGGRRQIVGFDRVSLGGWDALSGRRLWTIKPLVPGDFNVPTPVIVDGRLLVATENNGARLYAFDDQGVIVPRPVATNDHLAPDMSTSVIAGGRAFCVWQDLYCVSAKDLSEQWIGRHAALTDYGACIADDRRVLIVGKGGRLLLIDAQADQFRVVSQADVLPDDDTKVYSHPALVGSKLYLRGDRSLVCVELAP